MADYQRHIYEKDGPIARITFNRPERRNAHDTLFFQELCDALDDAEQDENVRVVVLTGNGPVFCAGQDLKFTASADRAQTLEYSAWNRRGRDKIQYLAKPVIARVNGDALGGGTYIATACDLIVALDGARLAMREINAGVHSGGAHLLTIGRQRSLEMNLLGRYVYAEEAAQWGLINKCVRTVEELDRQVAEWSELLVNLPPLGLRATKKATNLALELAGYQQLRQAEIGRDLFYTEDYWEAKRAFVEKRKPNFKGR